MTRILKRVLKSFTRLLNRINLRSDKDLDRELLNIVKSKNFNNGGNKNPELYILNNIVNIKEQKAIDILTPRVDIVAVSKDVELKALTNSFIKSGFSRLPVYNNTLDNILGFIHVKDIIDILRARGDLKIDDIIRKVLFVSPYIKILDLLFEMIAKRNHMAMVVDEFGGIDGLITIEDIIEEIVGDIRDEHDSLFVETIVNRQDGYIEAYARLTLKELEQNTGMFLTEEEKNEVETVGGLISFIAGRVPKKNEIIIHKSGVEFKVLAGDPIRVSKVGIYYNNVINEENKRRPD